MSDTSTSPSARMRRLTRLGQAYAMGMAELRPGGLAWFGAAMGVAHGLLYPALNAVAVEGVGARERGKVMALFQAAFQIGVATGAFGLGVLAELRGYPAVFVAGGVCVLAALLLFAASPEGRAPGRSGRLAGQAEEPVPVDPSLK